MKLLLVSQEYPPETAKGGLGTQTYLKAHGLAGRGHEVYVLSRIPHGQRHERMDGNVHVVRIPGFEDRLSLYTEVADWLTYSAEVAATVSQLHDQHHFDLVDFPEWAAEGYVYLLNRTEWNHLPAVIQLHGPLVMFAHTMNWPDKDSEFYRVGTHMEATCVRLADAIFSSSACTVDWCIRHYGLKPGNIPIIHTGVDTRHFYPRPVPKPDRPTIIFVGHIVRNKGVRQLVQAALKIAPHHPGLRVRLLGRGDDALIEHLTREAGDLLEVGGYVTRQDLPDQLSRAHVFAGPSLYEGGPGLTYLEAMACGLPVIACSGSGASEVVLHEKTGLLVPPDDVDTLATALDRVLTDTVYRETLGANARQYVVETADSEHCLTRLEEFYRSVIAK